MLQGGGGGSPSQQHNSNDVTQKQNSLFSVNNDTINDSNFNEVNAYNTVGSGSINAGAKGESSVGDIHSLYQDLFLTDIKKEVENTQHELK